MHHRDTEDTEKVMRLGLGSLNRQAQLLTYMKLGGWRLGLLINFNVPLLRDGIRRRIL